MNTIYFDSSEADGFCVRNRPEHTECFYSQKIFELEFKSYIVDVLEIK